MTDLQLKKVAFRDQLRGVVASQTPRAAGCLLSYAWATTPSGVAFYALVTFPRGELVPRATRVYPDLELAEEWITVDAGIGRCVKAIDGVIRLGGRDASDELQVLNRQWYSTDGRGAAAWPAHTWQLGWAAASQRRSDDAPRVASGLPPINSAVSAIEAWFSARTHLSFHPAPGQWIVLVLDARARVREVSWEEKACTIHVECAISAPTPEAQYIVLDSQNRVLRSHNQPVGAGPVSVDLEQAAGSIKTFVVGADGERLDQKHSHRERPTLLPALSFEQAALGDIYRGENERIEFKSWWRGKDPNYSKKIVTTVAAIANTHGGKLYIGVLDDQAAPQGVRELLDRGLGPPPLVAVQKQYDEVRKLLSDRLENMPRFTHRIDEVKGHYVLLLEISACGDVPCLVDKQPDIWVRRGSSTRRLAPDEYASHFRNRDGVDRFTLVR